MPKPKLDEICEATGEHYLDCSCKHCCDHSDGSENGICISCGGEKDLFGGESSFGVDGD